MMLKNASNRTGGIPSKIFSEIDQNVEELKTYISERSINEYL